MGVFVRVEMVHDIEKEVEEKDGFMTLLSGGELYSSWNEDVAFCDNEGHEGTMNAMKAP